MPNTAAIRAAVEKHCHIDIRWPASARIDDSHMDAFVTDLLAALAVGECGNGATPQLYTAELHLNGKYTWCIVKAIPRVETVIEEFGYGPDAYKTAQERLATLKASSLTEGDLAPESYRETVRKVAAAREKRLADLSDANVELRSALSQFQNVCAAWKDCDSVVTTVDLSVIRKALSLPSTERA